jgi:hypothetical protein
LLRKVDAAEVDMALDAVLPDIELLAAREDVVHPAEGLLLL